MRPVLSISPALFDKRVHSRSRGSKVNVFTRNGGGPELGAESDAMRSTKWQDGPNKHAPMTSRTAIASYRDCPDIAILYVFRGQMPSKVSGFHARASMKIWDSSSAVTFPFCPILVRDQKVHEGTVVFSSIKQ